MALSIDPDRVGMPSIDDWADSLFGPLHYDVGPGDPQLGLPEFDYHDGFELDGPDPLLPSYGLDAMELAEGPALLSSPLVGLDGVDDVGWTEVAAPTAAAGDLMVEAGELDLLGWDDIAALLSIQDVLVEEGDELADVAMAMAPAFGADVMDEGAALYTLGTLPAVGEDLLTEETDQDVLLLPLASDGVDEPGSYEAGFPG